MDSIIILSDESPCLHLIDRVTPRSMLLVSGDNLQSNTEEISGKNNVESSNSEQGNNDRDPNDEIENSSKVGKEPEQEQIKTTRKPNSNFEQKQRKAKGSLPNGMQARKGNELTIDSMMSFNLH